MLFRGSCYGSPRRRFAAPSYTVATAVIALAIDVSALVYVSWEPLVYDEPTASAWESVEAANFAEYCLLVGVTWVDVCRILKKFSLSCSLSRKRVSTFLVTVQLYQYRSASDCFFFKSYLFGVLKDRPEVFTKHSWHRWCRQKLK